MDTLSQMLQATRTRSPLIADMRLGSDISVGIQSLGGMPFHYVVEGSCRLESGADTVALGTGDFVMLVRSPNYRFQTGNGTTRIEVMDFAEHDGFSVSDLRSGRDHFLRRDIGEQPMQARIFSAILMPGNGPEAGPLTRDLPALMLQRNVKAQLEPWLGAAIDLMSPKSREPEPGLSAIAERLIELTFVSMLRNWLLDAPHKPGWMRGLTNPTISRVLNAMHEQPGRRWSLNDLAEVAGRSRSSLAEHFRDEMGETPFAYLTRWRMHLAAAAVARGDRSVAAVAVSLGYQGPQAFSRAFLAASGETPAKYRRRRANASVC